METSRAVARAILPVKSAPLTGRIARATFRAGALRRSALHAAPNVLNRVPFMPGIFFLSDFSDRILARRSSHFTWLKQQVIVILTAARFIQKLFA